MSGGHLVTIVSHDVGPVSGMERQLADLVDGLVARDVRVRVIARTCNVEATDAVEHVRIGPPVRPFSVGFPWFAIRAAQAVRQSPPGIVHIAGCLAPIRADVVALHFLHAGAALAGAAPRLPSASLPYRLNQGIARRQYLAAERWQLQPRHHHALVAVSGGLAEEVRLHYPEASAPQVIPNGIDIARFAPGPADPAVRKELAPAGGTSLAAFVGGGWDGKGLMQAIGALAAAPGWGLAVVGDGDERPFVAEARRLGVADRVRFAGARDDLPAVYRSVDALVLPSAYETFSLVAHEAAASGCPVIATRVSGITDILRDGYNGFLVDRDSRAVAEALRRLEAIGPAELATLTQAARAAVEDRTTGAMVEAHLELYSRLATVT